MNQISYQLRSRIAPTPSGFLHLGNVFSFVLTWLIVRQNKGHLLLRIDDLDAQRRRIEYIDDIFSTLEWLDLDYDEGASGTADFFQNFSQETRLQNYEKLLTELINIQSSLIFECRCSRADIQRNSTKGLYAGTCRESRVVSRIPPNGHSNNGEVAWRIKVPSETIVFQDVLKGQIEISLAKQMGDFVVRKKDGLPAYQVASLSDDLEYNINYIVRGEDLIDSTVAQAFLAQLLDKKQFTESHFLHHPLLRLPNNEKLSKSAGATAVQSLRKEVASPQLIFQWIAGELGLSSKIKNLHELLEAFELKEITSLHSLTL